MIANTSCTFDQLPDEVFLKIFSYLDLRSLHHSGQTSRRWSKLSRRAWRSLRSIKFVSLFSEPSLPKGKYLNKALHYVLKKCGRNLRVLNLVDPIPEFRFVKTNERTFEIIGKYCSNLEEINFTDVLLLNDLLHCLVNCVKNCATLKVLDMHSSFNHYCVIHDGLGAIYAACTSLQRLDISNSLNARVRDCREPWPSTLTDVRVDNAWALTSYSLMTLARCCRCLSSFSMNGNASGMDAGVEYILNNCNLTKLSLVDYPGTVELGMIICHLSHLRELYLGDSPMACDFVLIAVARSCPNLDVLQCNAASTSKTPLTNECLEDIGKYLPDLSSFMLNNRNFISDDGMASICLNGKLKRLSISGCSNISDDTLQVLATGCAQLRRIDVSSTSSVTADGLIALCTGWFGSNDTDSRSYTLDIYAEDNVLNWSDVVKYFNLTSTEQIREFSKVENGIRKTVHIFTDLYFSIFV